MANFGIWPKICRQFAANIIYIGFTADTSLSILRKIKSRPLASLQYRLRLLFCDLKRQS